MNYTYKQHNDGTVSLYINNLWACFCPSMAYAKRVFNNKAEQND